VKVWPDVRAAPAARLAGEPGLNVGKSDIIRPSVAADRRPMAALVIRAIDQQAANATGTHFSKSDFLAGKGFDHLNETEIVTRIVTPAIF